MHQPTTPDDPLSRFSLAVFRVNGLLLQSGEQVTKPHGQSSARWHVLSHANRKEQTVAQIARSIGNSRQSVQRIAHSLTKEGLTQFKANPTDRRAPLVELTPEGERVLAAIYEQDREWSRELIVSLDTESLNDIADKLNDISHVLNKYIIEQSLQERAVHENSNL